MQLKTAVRYLQSEYIPLASLVCLLSGLLFSRAMVSIGMISLAVYAVVITDVRNNFKKFAHDKILMALTVVFFIYVLSGLNSADRDFWMDRVRMKLPFLFLPFSFSALKQKISGRHINMLLLFFFLMVVCTSLFYCIQYFHTYHQMEVEYSQGRTMLTPFNHVRYSLVVAICIFLGIYFLLSNFFVKYPTERYFILVATAFLVFYLHLLAVRSGVLAFYLGAFYMVIHFIFKKKNFRTGAVLFSIVIVAPLIAYYTLPSVKAKVNYMKYDWSQLFQFHNANGLSDGGRILSIQMGYEIMLDHPVAGIGMGDLKNEMKQKLESAPQQPNDALLPHNQFIFVGAGCGIIAMLLFAAIVFFPLFRKKLNREWLFVCFNIVLLSSFLSEATIEEQIGTAFYLVILLLLCLKFENDAV